jgi:hypothetical protein
MKVTIDGYKIATLIGSNPGIFSDVRLELQKAVLSVLFVQLKSKSLTLDKLKAVRSTLGAENFLLVLGHLDKPLAAITKKLDPHCLDQKGANPDWHRKRLDSIASGASQPAEKNVPAPATKSAAKAPTKKGLRVTEDNFYPESMTKPLRKREG